MVEHRKLMGVKCEIRNQTGDAPQSECLRTGGGGQNV